MEEGSTSTPGSGSEVETPPPASAEGPVDTVRLWEEGYADRYYQQSSTWILQTLNFATK